MKGCQVVGCTCVMEEVLVSLDDGKSKITICPNHLVVFSRHLFKLEGKIRKGKSERVENHSCDCCEEKESVEYQDAEATFYLCEKHLQKLIDLNLSRKEFKILQQKAGNVFILHDDFYDPLTGKALQSRKVRS